MQITRLMRRGLLVMAFAGPAFSQAYPEKTVRIVTSGVGGAGDMASRLIAHRLHEEITRFLHTQEAKEKFLAIGVEAIGSAPDRLASVMKSEMDRLGKIINAERMREQ